MTNIIFTSVRIINTMMSKLQNKTVFYNDLPESVKAFAQHNFPGRSVTFIEKDRDAYTLTFNDDTKVTVDQDGNWQKMDYSQEQVLLSLLPDSIVADIHNKFSGAHVVSAVKNAKGYALELTNAICMKYDGRGLATC